MAAKKTNALRVEPLEDRAVPSVDVRSYDGSGNNTAHPDWGKAGTDFLRRAPAQYADGASAPAGGSRPSARVISNAIAAQGDREIPNDRMMSALVYAWGQFIDHDLDLTPTVSGQAFNVKVPAGDPWFDPNNTGTQVIPLTRSSYDAVTGTTSPRQQVNAISTWLDGSMVYGSSAATAASLRTFQGGKMKTSAGNLLPKDAAGNFLAGDTRVNENPELTSLHTLFVREHNRVAGQIAATTPGLSDEEVFQRARAFVIGEIEAITYKEWLPALLGAGAAPYAGYKPTVNPGIANEFAAAGFRFGHSLLGDDIGFLDNNGHEIAPELPLAQAFFNPSVVQSKGIDPILKYLASDPSSEVDPKVVDGVRNFLFGPPGAGGLDLASLNIQRGRDHGLADYNTTRASYGLPRVTDFNQITRNPDLQAKLKQLYGTANNIDLWVGVLAEDHAPGASVGPTLRAIVLDQFNRLRDADRFWYQKAFAGTPQLQDLERTTLADVIRRNSVVTNLQPNAFYFKAEISGKVVIDANRDRVLNPGDPPAIGKRVELVNLEDGSVVATTFASTTGFYRFGVPDGLRTGDYVVRVPEAGGPGTPPMTSRPLSITRGDTVWGGVDFLLPPPRGQQPPPPREMMAGDFFTLNGPDVNDPLKPRR